MQVVIIDTGCANLTSVYNALNRLNIAPIISTDEQQILAADKLILPGVGSAVFGMQNLAARKLVKLIKACQQPVLGICLGMQMLAKTSSETSTEQPIELLNIIDQPVDKLPCSELPLPHMGWNRVYYRDQHPLFKQIEQGAYFYFVHSFAMANNVHTIARCNYGIDFSAAIERDNFYGVQFHPERSSRSGAQLLQNFVEL